MGYFLDYFSADSSLAADIQDVLSRGTKDENPRPKYSDGTPAYTLSVPHNVRNYDLREEFPITELRPIAWKSAIKEILWIYQDQTSDLEVLREKYGVKYWDAWESKDIPGTIGIRYGATVCLHDLTNKLIKGLKEDPFSRRHIINLWQEDDFDRSDGLMPCAFMTQFTVAKENGEYYLDMMLYQRSGDMLAASGAGCINEVQYAAFQMMIAKATGYIPRNFTHVICNEQIYDRHIEQAKELVKRYERRMHKASKRPRLIFKPKSDDFYSFTIDDFKLENYNPVKPQLKFDLGI